MSKMLPNRRCLQLMGSLFGSVGMGPPGSIFLGKCGVGPFENLPNLEVWCWASVVLGSSCLPLVAGACLLVGSVVLGLRCGDGFTVHVDCLLSACGLFPFER